MRVCPSRNLFRQEVARIELELQTKIQQLQVASSLKFLDGPGGWLDVESVPMFFLNMFF